MHPPSDEHGPPTAHDTWIGCPHCGQAVSIAAQVARAQREVAEQVFGLLHEGVPLGHVLPAVERVGHEAGWIEDAARVRSGPLRHLALPEPPDAAPHGTAPASGKDYEEGPPIARRPVA